MVENDSKKVPILARKFKWHQKYFVLPIFGAKIQIIRKIEIPLFMILFLARKFKSFAQFFRESNKRTVLFFKKRSDIETFLKPFFNTVPNATQK